MNPNFIALLNEKIISLCTLPFCFFSFGNIVRKRRCVLQTPVDYQFFEGKFSVLCILVLSAFKSGSWKNLKDIGWLQRTIEGYTVKTDPPVNCLRTNYFQNRNKYRRGGVLVTIKTPQRPPWTTEAQPQALCIGLPSSLPTHWALYKGVDVSVKVLGLRLP